MSLSLKVNSFHKFTSEMESEFVISDENNKNTVSFGRSEACDWQFPDPERVISNVHGEIIPFGGDYLIRDLSTNGIFLNNSVTALGLGNEIKINDNDVINFGDYEVVVEINSGNTTLLTDNDDNKIVSNESQNGFGVDINVLLSQEPNHESIFESNLGLSDDFFDLESTSPVRQFSAEPSTTMSPPAPIHEDNQSQRPEQTAQLAQTSQLAEGNEMAAFLKGMGISPQMVPVHGKDAWFEMLGSSFTLLLSGLMETLHHRAAFKQSNRLNHTAFQRHENNPLKFSANVEDAIHNLYNRNSASFLGPLQSIEEAFDDIEKHEKALMHGVEGAVSGVMNLLEPSYITNQNFKVGVLDKLIPNNSAVNYWKRYEKIFIELNNEIQAGNSPFYLEDFAKSYEVALKKVERSTK
ncbi:type VI secretion system-associated FHA domain protein TagH [Vibrio tapetis subsp. quintayensis]|uniref:type VI secretion system-associated FHA domain protein TagH n=1 Tax=Vibrio tapetis TaxID=52443 RepID=UPI0025B2813F|nr:type VI secretion system-associated FHA domain protein TagH [Vibrio tapetis]MDN3681072.1 type VI secretion system-associated FHA domain protein TagH [Vibrio tapetis subsp. quintayensis]